MPSFKSQAILWLLKHSHWFRLQFHKPSFDPSPEGIRRFRLKTKNAAMEKISDFIRDKLGENA